MAAATVRANSVVGRQCQAASDAKSRWEPRRPWRWSGRLLALCGRRSAGSKGRSPSTSRAGGSAPIGSILWIDPIGADPLAREVDGERPFAPALRRRDRRRS